MVPKGHIKIIELLLLLLLVLLVGIFIMQAQAKA